MLKAIKLLFVLLIATQFFGCAGLPDESDYPEYTSFPAAPDYSSRTYVPEPKHSGIYHKVRKGETIFRIAKAYNVPMGDIITSNNIPDVARIEENQLILIPGATSVKEIFVETISDENQKEFVWPVKGKVIRYYRQGGKGGKYQGIDIQAREGDVVKASRRGKVVFADQLPGFGHTVILDHLDGFHSVYSHNGDLSVSLNQSIHKNQEIARVGEVNRKSYLHFQIRKNAIEDNPLYYLP